MRPTDKIVIAVCPRAEDLAAYQAGGIVEPRLGKMQAHVAACPLCRKELAWLDETSIDKINVVEMPRRRWPVYLAVAAAAAVLAVTPLFRTQGFADLAEAPYLDRAGLMETFGNRPDLRPDFVQAMTGYESGDLALAEAKIGRVLAELPGDPSTLLLAGLVQHKRGRLQEAAKLAAQSEQAEPMSEYRCWIALQLALLAGDRAGIARECDDLEDHARFQQKVRAIRDAVNRRRV